MRIALPANFGPWDKVGMIGCVSANAKLYFRFKVVKKEGIQAKDVAAFLRPLLHHEPGQVVVF